MKHAASQSSSKKVVQSQNHAAIFAKVLDGRKQPVRGLWQRNGRYYAQISVEDFSTGLKRVRRGPLVNPDGNPVESVAQAITEINRLRTYRSEDSLPKLGRTPTFADYADAYLTQVKAGNEKKGQHDWKRGKHHRPMEKSSWRNPPRQDTPGARCQHDE